MNSITGRIKIATIANEAVIMLRTDRLKRISKYYSMIYNINNIRLGRKQNNILLLKQI